MLRISQQFFIHSPDCYTISFSSQ